MAGKIGIHKLFAVELLLISFFVFVEKSESFKCYVCRSDMDKECGSSVNQKYSKECPPKNGTGTYCRKISQMLRFKNQKSWTSIRECAYEKSSSHCYKFKWVNLAYQETCECIQENCNRGNNLLPSILTVVCTFFLVRVYNYVKNVYT